MLNNLVITSTAQLTEFCAQLSGETFLAIDTEFIREKTYYPLLCLVQVAGASGACAIDPLAPGLDLAPLLALLSNPGILKVFHAGRQDVEIFYLLTGKIPTPVFDTQVAAQFCGFGESISYSDFIRRTVNVAIDKASRFTDWARRPLTQKQVTYALADVIHLRDAYLTLIEKLEKTGRSSWVADEMTTLTSPASYENDPEEAWRRLKLGGLKPRQLAALKAIARWRELESQKRDLPRSRLIKDETLLEIAASLPASAEELRHVRGTGSLNGAMVETLVKQVADALASPPESWPTLPARPANAPARGDIIALLQMLLSVQCSRHNILPRLVATRDELDAIAQHETDVRALKDWRGEIFGNAAQKLLNGQLKLFYDPGTRQVMLEE